MPLLSIRNANPPINPTQGIISVYTQIVGPRAKRTIKMALDTGASFILIPPEKIIATGYSIPASPKRIIKIFTASGIEYVPLITISSLKCLGVTVKNIDVVCHSLPAESPVEGLLGLNFLIRLPAFIEFFQKIQHFCK